MNLNQNTIYFSAAMIKDLVKVSLPIALAHEKPLINELEKEELDLIKFVLEIKFIVKAFV